MDDRHLRALIGERHPASSPTALQQAEGYLTEQFKVLGLEVSAHPFKALGDTYRNVVGTRPASHPLPESDAPVPRAPTTMPARWRCCWKWPGAFGASR
jgi:hypothetical protein